MGERGNGTGERAAQLTISTRLDQGVQVLALGGEADLASELALRASLERTVTHATVPTVIDLSGLSFCDLRSMRLLAAAGRAGIPSGRGYALAGMTGVVARLWQVGFAGSLPADQLPSQHATATQAVTSLATAREVPARTTGPTRVLDRTGADEASHSASRCARRTDRRSSEAADDPSAHRAPDRDFISRLLRELLDQRWHQSVDDVTELTVRLHDLHAEIEKARGDKGRLNTELADTETRLAHSRRGLADNDAAIQRLAKGTYGFCGHCGGTIAEEHLVTVPSARLCASCQFWSCQTEPSIGDGH